MTADVAQERNVAKLVQPFGIVDGHGVRGAVAEGQELLEDLEDARLVAVDNLRRHELARLVTARRVADLRGAAAHQDDRLVARLLQPAQHHDLDEAADVQALCGQVEADIGDDGLAAGGLFVQAFEIGALVHEAARRHGAEEIGFGLAHGSIDLRGTTAGPWPRGGHGA